MRTERVFKSITALASRRRWRALVSARRQLLLCLLGLAALSALVTALWVREQARQSLTRERERQARQEFIPFEKNLRAPLSRPGIKFWQSTENTRAITRFQDSYFTATDGGLMQLSPEGKFLRHYTMLDGLTESDLISLALFDSKLFIGTATRGLLSFDGEQFESYRWLDRDALAVTAMLADGGRLLIGTFNGGLLEFDGQRFRELRAGAEKTRLRGINCLSRAGARLYVGTFDDGLWLMEAGRWLHFEAADGLASNRVVGVVADGQEVFVATDFGLSVATSDGLQQVTAAPQKSFRTLITLPSLTSLVSYNGLLLLSKDNGEILAMDERAGDRGQIQNLAWARPEELSNSRLTVADERLWLLNSRGIWGAPEDLSQPLRAQLSLTQFGSSHDGQALASNIVSALALDRDGNFWAGNFRRGIDVFSGEGRKLAHLESEAIREVNFLLPESERATTVLAATSQGIERFDSQFHHASITKTDGLPGNSVMHLALAGETSPAQSKAAPAKALVLATTRGLALSQAGGWRVLTTVQGLPSDQVYATLSFKGALFVGTLGGLAEVQSNRVVRVFKDSNSKLTHNWVTSLCAAGDRLFVGTYGGGVFELTAANDLRSFAPEIGTPVVNPNAMWSDGETLFVGTLDGAWAFHLRSQKWTRLKEELPAKIVLSVTGDDRFIYFGTTNGIARVEKSYLAEL